MALPVDPIRWTPPILLIGLGNPLRGDDAVGRSIADTVAAWHLAGVVVRSTHQLVPELALELADVNHLVIADARIDTRTTGVTLERFQTVANTTFLGHHLDLSQLLGLAKSLHGRLPTCWLLTIPALQWEIGTERSQPNREAEAVALCLLRSILDR